MVHKRLIMFAVHYVLNTSSFSKPTPGWISGRNTFADIILCVWEV